MKSTFALYFLYATIITLYFRYTTSHELLCRHCKKPIADSNNIINIKTNVSLNSNYRNLFGRRNILAHTFKNPHNVFYEIVTTSKILNLACEKKPHKEHTFFPGFGWKACVCPHCMKHHGWEFSPMDSLCQVEEKEDYDSCINKESFYGLVTENLEYNIQEMIVEL
jgi:hypothetical protein